MRKTVWSTFTIFSLLASKIRWDNGLWITWPKKSSGIETDLTENVVRAAICPSPREPFHRLKLIAGDPVCG